MLLSADLSRRLRIVRSKDYHGLHVNHEVARLELSALLSLYHFRVPIQDTTIILGYKKGSEVTAVGVNLQFSTGNTFATGWVFLQRIRYYVY